MERLQLRHNGSEIQNESVSGVRGRNKGEEKPQQRVCEEPTALQSLCSLVLHHICAAAAQLRTDNYQTNACSRGEGCLLGKSTCEGVLLWLLSENACPLN